MTIAVQLSGLDLGSPESAVDPQHLTITRVNDRTRLFGIESSINSVEPLMSANSAVTVLRSPRGIDSGSASTVIAMDLFDAVKSVLRADTASVIKREPHFL